MHRTARRNHFKRWPVLEALEPRCLLTAVSFSHHELVRSEVTSVVAGKLVDFDTDGDLDIVNLIAMVYDHLEIYENQSGTFSSGRVISIPGSGDLTQLLPADIDGDGDIDLVYTRTEDSIYWLENDNGLGNFANPVTIVSPVDPLVGITLLSADMDSDRDTDLVVASHVNAPLVPIVWLENRLVGDVNRDGRFSSNDLILVLQANEFEDDSSNNSSFEEGDWNGDGDFTRADLVVALQSGVYVTGPA